MLLYINDKSFSLSTKIYEKLPKRILVSSYCTCCCTLVTYTWFLIKFRYADCDIVCLKWPPKYGFFPYRKFSIPFRLKISPISKYYAKKTCLKKNSQFPLSSQNKRNGVVLKKTSISLAVYDFLTCLPDNNQIYRHMITKYCLQVLKFLKSTLQLME